MNSRRLDPLIRRAADRENTAAKQFADKAKALASHEQRLKDLERYAQEYAPPTEGEINPAMLLNRLAFRQKIDHAVSQQQRAVENSRVSCDMERARLMLASRDAKVLEKLASSYRQQEQKQEARREQGQLDELAIRGVIARREEGEQT